MALITTATVDLGEPETWDYPGVSDNIIPIGRMNYAATVTIALIDAANTGLWTFTATLPRNFVYVCTRCKIQTFSDDEFSLDTWEEFITGETVDGAGTTIDWFTNLRLEAHVSSQSSLWIAPGSADSRTSSYGVRDASGWPGASIDTGEGDGAVRLSWFNGSAGEIAITTIQYRLSLLQYTIEQFRKYPIHTGLPVIGAV